VLIKSRYMVTLGYRDGGGGGGYSRGYGGGGGSRGTYEQHEEGQGGGWN